MRLASLRHFWRTFWNLDPARRMVLLEAVCALVAVRAAMRLLPFRALARTFGRVSPHAGATTSSASVSARRVGWAVAAVARHLPRESTCLAQAVAGRWMLRRRAIPSTLYIGVDKSAGFEAHAWLSSGERVLLGGGEHARFKVIAQYGE